MKTTTTGLRKKCPRCPAIGEITADGPSTIDGARRFTVRWSIGGARSWLDVNVGLEHLVDPTFGCGYDDAEEP